VRRCGAEARTVAHSWGVRAKSKPRKRR
jgi:hypothetical protein